MKSHAPFIVAIAFLSSVPAVLVGCGDIIPTEDRCTVYCTDVTNTCTGANAQYVSEAACKTYCGDVAQIPLGAVGDQGSDTVECRIYHAGNAALDPGTHCPHSGPTGGAVCGGYCDNYCRLMALNCPGKFASSQACTAACGAFETNGKVNDTDGDTVQCRIHHAGLAGAERGTAGSDQLCDLAMPGSTQCAPTTPADCDDFCDVVTANCVGEDAMYGSVSDCNDVCDEFAGWREGVVGDTGSNTVGCRQHAATQAGLTTDADEKEQFCKNSSETGGGVCGTLCDNYCDLVARNCPSNFPARTDCQEACSTMSSDGDPGDTDGNTVQCRITFAAGAGATGADTSLLCGSATPESTPCQ